MSRLNQVRSGRKRFVIGLAALVVLTASFEVGMAVGPVTALPLDVADSPGIAIERALKEPPAFHPEGGLAHYLAFAATQNPAVRAAFYRWQGELEETGYVGALPDPTLMYSYFIENVETRVGPQNQRLSLRQSFPWFGTLAARKDAAGQAALAAHRELQAAEQRLFYQVKAAYCDYYYLGCEVEITRENLELLKFWESVVREKYRVSLAQHSDLIKAQVELGMLEDRLLRLEDLLAPAAARLRALLNVPPNVALPVPVDIETDEVTLDRELIVEHAQDRNPGLHSLEALIAEAGARRREAKSLALPGITLGFDYIETGEAVVPTAESGKDPWIVSAAVNVPLWFGKNNARKRAAVARQKQAHYNLADARNRLGALIVSTLAEHDDALRKLRLYRDGLVPKAEQSLNAAYAAYRAGEADFLGLLDAQRQLLEFQLRLERARTDLATRRAELEMQVGAPLEDQVG